jgi:hypothetical protein
VRAARFAVLEAVGGRLCDGRGRQLARQPREGAGRPEHVEGRGREDRVVGVSERWREPTKMPWLLE